MREYETNALIDKEQFYVTDKTPVGEIWTSYECEKEQFLTLLTSNKGQVIFLSSSDTYSSALKDHENWVKKINKWLKPTDAAHKHYPENTLITFLYFLSLEDDYGNRNKPVQKSGL